MGRTYENDVRDKSTLQLNFVKVLKIKESRLMEGDISRLLSLCPNLERRPVSDIILVGATHDARVEA